MSLGSFCTTIGDKTITIQPKTLTIDGFQIGFIQNLQITQSIQTMIDLNEISYIFPTDNKLCIYNMQFKIGDEIIKTEIKSNKIAKETFEEAKSLGKTAILASQKEPGITSIVIGNVPKNKIVSVTFNCATTSMLEKANVILTKIPLQGCEPDGSYTYLYDLPSLEINLGMEISQLKKIANISANCEYEYEKTNDFNGKIRINSALITDENILIRIELKKSVQSQLITSEKCACLSVIPKFHASKTNYDKEYVFLIDCSASMNGESLRKAQEALKLFISKIPSKCYFNIIKFGSNYSKLFENSSIKDKKNKMKALAFIEEMKANLGGTEMLSMFENLFSEQLATSNPRQIFLVTDGEVYQREKVVALINENHKFNRIFAIGLGLGADAGFLDEIAGITNGKYDFVANKENLPIKVAEHIELSKIDSAKNAEIHINDNDSFEVVPYPLPQLLPNVVQHMFITSDSPINDVMLTAKIKNDIGNQIDIENIISLKGQMTNKDPIFALFAQSQLKNLENDEEKSIKLSLSSGVLSKFTSYIAVSNDKYVKYSEINDTQNEIYTNCYSSSSKRRCYKSHHHHIKTRHNLCCKHSSRSYADHVVRRKRKYSSIKSNVSYDDYDSNEDEYIVANTSYNIENGNIDNIEEIVNGKRNPDEIKKEWTNNATVSDIIRLQSRDGFWDLSLSFMNEKIEEKNISNNIEFASYSPLIVKRIIATIFTIAYLEKIYIKKIAQWTNSKGKGLKWLIKINSTINWEQIISNIISKIIN